MAGHIGEIDKDCFKRRESFKKWLWEPRLYVHEIPGDSGFPDMVFVQIHHTICQILLRWDYK